MKKKMLCVLLAAAMASTMIAGCGSKGEAERDKKEILICDGTGR